MGRLAKYRQRAERLLGALERIGSEARRGTAAHDERTPAQLALRIVATTLIADKDRDALRASCIEFGSRINDGAKRRRALDLFAYVLGDSGRRVLREGEVAIRREDFELLERLAADVAIDSILLSDEVTEAPRAPASASDDDYWRRRLAEDLEALA